MLSLIFPSGGKEKKFIGLTVYRDDDAFIHEVAKYLEIESRDSIEIRTVAAEGNQDLQNEQAAAFIREGASAIIVNTADRTASGLIIEKCRMNDIPLVFFNRQPLKDDMMKWEKTYYVGGLGGAGGSIAADYFSSYWADHPELDRNNDGILQFVLIKGEPGHQDTELRTEYLLNTLSANGIRLDKLDEANGRWMRDNARGVMNRFLSVYPDSIEAVFCNNDEMALGAIDALKEAGWFDNGKYMPVTGCDGTPAGMEALEDGTMLCTVLNDAENQAKAIYALAVDLVDGKTPEGEIAGYPMDGHYIWIPYQALIREGE